MAYDLYAVVKEPGTNKVCKHLHGSYGTKLLANWWAINAKAVWHGGPSGPQRILYKDSSIIRWEIEET